MFTLEQIKEAHQTIVKTGADFPKYIQRLIELGVASYETFVNDGHTLYCGKENTQLQTDARYEALQVAEKSDNEKFVLLLKSHQQGKTDFPTFCSDCAKTGVEKWKVDTSTMTCTYYDLSGNKMLAEQIPAIQ